ncbi:hypothetical protein [Nocardia sp. NPDC051750]|uniref:hypothetical protein n=1 Tax=Nocardia sp. NPDC051750 TaxID=3364325 RepID=UPI00378D9F29
MRTLRFRRTTSLFGLIALTAAAVIGCGDSDENAAAATSAPAATSSAAPAAASPETKKEITNAFVTFFDGKADPATRAGLVEKGDEFAPFLQGMAADPRAQGTSVTVSAVEVVDDKTADVTYTLLLGGNPVLPDQSGQAIKEGDTWKVASMTFCALLAVQGTGEAIPACS